MERQIEDLTEEEEEERSFSTPSETERQRGKAARSKKAPSYSIVKDLTLRPNGKQSLREFFQSKKPSDQQQHLTAVIYYLSHILEIENVTINHVYTALKEVGDLGVRVPGDIAQGLRNIANRKGWVDSSNADSLKITVRGENFIEHDLPKLKDVGSPGTELEFAL